MNAEMEGNLSRLISGLWVLHLRMREMMRTSVATSRLIALAGARGYAQSVARNYRSLSRGSLTELLVCEWLPTGPRSPAWRLRAIVGT